MTGGAPLFLREVLHAAHVDGALVQRHDVWCWDGELRATDRLTELMEAAPAHDWPTVPAGGRADRVR